jgi:hypothetical protein
MMPLLARGPLQGAGDSMYTVAQFNDQNSGKLVETAVSGNELAEFFWS